jgi:hypothetical protein
MAASRAWGMALWTQPDNLLTTALGHLVGRGIAGVPFLQKSGVIFHGAARTETATPTSTVGADYVPPLRVSEFITASHSCCLPQS